MCRAEGPVAASRPGGPSSPQPPSTNTSIPSASAGPAPPTIKPAGHTPAPSVQPNPPAASPVVTATEPRGAPVAKATEPDSGEYSMLRDAPRGTTLSSAGSPLKDEAVGGWCFAPWGFRIG